MITVKRRIYSVIGLGAVFSAFTIAGIYREEYLDVIINATILCFSCIGIK